MSKKKTKGFTLIEVILSIAIFAIISVGFLGMFSTVFIQTYRSTAVTEAAFLAQQEIEDQIASVKSDLENNITPTGLTSSTIELFSGTNLRNVVVYHLQQEVTSDQVLETYIAQSRAPLLQTPNITSAVTIAAFSSSTKVTYPNIGMPSLSVDLENDLVVDNPGYLIRYLYYWYISNPGYYLPSSPPSFPDNYQIITDHTSRLISEVPSSYSGRFLKLVVTPVGEKGQMGTSVESNALYISSMPLNDNVILHLDSNYINKDDAVQVRSATSGGLVYNYIKQWNDLSTSALNLTQTTTSSQPIFYQYTLGADTLLERKIQGSLGFATGTNMSLKTGTTPNIGSLANMTVYMVAKFDPTYPVSSTIFQTKATSAGSNRWTLNTDANGNLTLVRYLDTTSSTKTVATIDDTYMDGNWKVIKLDIWQNQLSIKIDDATPATLTGFTTTSVMQFTDFKINFNSNLSIAEVVVFNNMQATDSAEAIAMYQYLNEKYKPS